jgi:hypothetical protein
VTDIGSSLEQLVTSNQRPVLLATMLLERSKQAQHEPEMYISERVALVHDARTPEKVVIRSCM